MKASIKRSASPKHPPGHLGYGNILKMSESTHWASTSSLLQSLLPSPHPWNHSIHWSIECISLLRPSSSSSASYIYLPPSILFFSPHRTTPTPTFQPDCKILRPPTDEFIDMTFTLLLHWRQNIIIQGYQHRWNYFSIVSGGKIKLLSQKKSQNKPSVIFPPCRLKLSKLFSVVPYLKLHSVCMFYSWMCVCVCVCVCVGPPDFIYRSFLPLPFIYYLQLFFKIQRAESGVLQQDALNAIRCSQTMTLLSASLMANAVCWTWMLDRHAKTQITWILKGHYNCFLASSVQIIHQSVQQDPLVLLLQQTPVCMSL